MAELQAQVEQIKSLEKEKELVSVHIFCSTCLQFVSSSGTLADYYWPSHFIKSFYPDLVCLFGWFLNVLVNY